MNTMKEGAVTFLDVLGWKGIWQRKDNAMEQIIEIIDDAQKYMKKIISAEKLKDGKPNNYKDLIVDIKSISDTIVLITEGDVSIALTFHAAITGKLLTRSIALGIPLRGATGYGKYSVNGNVMIGPIIDEVASWYETANWIGVIQVPSATFLCDFSRKRYLKDEFKEGAFYIPYQVNIKNQPKMKLLCTNWIYYWNDEKRDFYDLTKSFSELQPIYPDIAAKLLNTLDYYIFVEKNQIKKNTAMESTSGSQ